MGNFTILNPGNRFFAVLLFKLIATATANGQLSVMVSYTGGADSTLASSYTSLANAVTALKGATLSCTAGNFVLRFWTPVSCFSNTNWRGFCPCNNVTNIYLTL